MLEILQHTDLQIVHFINQTLSTPTLNIFFPFATDIHKNIYFSIPAISLIIFFLIKKYKKAGLMYFFFFVCSVGLSDFTGSVVKNHFNRPRPYTQSTLTIEQRSPANPSKSFYSNHSSNSFAIANYLGFVFPAGRLIYFALAIMIAYSRMYNGVHYPSDIICGAIMGLVISYSLYRTACLAQRKLLTQRSKQ